MIIWVNLQLPPINLWSYPDYINIKKQEKAMNEKHRKFAKYWESIGRPQLEIWYGGNWSVAVRATMFTSQDYRIKGDPHWKLRRKWIDSDFKLRIACFNVTEKVWTEITNPRWFKDCKYVEVCSCKPQHKKFKAYWESIGKPPLEVWLIDNWYSLVDEPGFTSHDYCIKDDPHWELRRKWIDSDFTLPIEYLDKSDGEWLLCRMRYPCWAHSDSYREAIPKPAYSKEYKAGYDHGFKDAAEKLETLLEQMYAARSKDG